MRVYAWVPLVLTRLGAVVAVVAQTALAESDNQLQYHHMMQILQHFIASAVGHSKTPAGVDEILAETVLNLGYYCLQVPTPITTTCGSKLYTLADTHTRCLLRL